VCGSKYPDFSVYFARAGQNFEIPTRPLSYTSSVPAVEGERNLAWFRVCVANL
jgi:hypothetical protein